MPNSERKNEKYTVSFHYPDPGNLLGTSEVMYADRDEAVAAAARASRDPENENIQVYHQWFNTKFNRTEGEWIDWRNTEDLLPEYPAPNASDTECDAASFHKSVCRKSWKEFRETGLFRFVNAFLHIFGWAIVLNADDDGTITEVFPARITYRGFSEESMTTGYRQVSKFMAEHGCELQKEAES